MEVHYDDASHTYFTLEGGRKVFYTSATTLIGKYKVPFDARKMAEITARKRGGTPEQWIKEWSKTSKKACDYGSKVHNKFEADMLATGTTEVNGRVLPVQNSVTLLDYTLLPDGVYPELKLWNHEHRIAGRADVIILETIAGQRYMHVEDYKTNKEIAMEGYLFRDGSFKVMLSPVEHLHCCNYNHYNLQLSLYQFMGEAMGFKPGYRRMIHVPKDGDRTDYELPYLKNEITSILTHYKQLTHGNAGTRPQKA